MPWYTTIGAAVNDECVQTRDAKKRVIPFIRDYVHQFSDYENISRQNSYFSGSLEKLWYFRLCLRGVSEKYPTCVYIFAPERSIGLCGV